MTKICGHSLGLLLGERKLSILCGNKAIDPLIVKSSKWQCIVRLIQVSSKVVAGVPGQARHNPRAGSTSGADDQRSGSDSEHEILQVFVTALTAA